MPFHAESSKELDGLAPGSRIDFQLKVSSHATLVRHIHVQQIGIENLKIPKAEGKVAVGEPMPDFTLTDQDGRPVTLSQFRGSLVAIDFIYTRCPLPDVCPRLSANFARLQKRFGGKITLLSITIDPRYDTPAVLTDYAHRWHADTKSWRFLTGSEDEIQKIAGHFGVVFWAEEGAITHTSSTAIIDPSGKLVAMLEGSSYTSQQLLDLVGHASGLP